MVSHSLPATPVINMASFEDMLDEEANFTPSHQPRHVKFMDMMEGGLTSTPGNVQQEVALPAKPTYEIYPAEIGLHAATCKLSKMQELKISKLKGSYTSSAGLVFQSWLKDIHVNVPDRRLMQREAM